MYGYPSGFRSPAAAAGGVVGGWGSQLLQQQQQPPQQQQQPPPPPAAPVALLDNPSFSLQNPNYFLQNPQAALVFLQQHQQQQQQQQQQLQQQQQQHQQQQQFLLQNQNPNTFPIQNPPPSNNPNLHIPPPQNLNQNQNQNQQFSNSKQTHSIEKVNRQNISPPQNPKLPNSKQTNSIDKVDRAVAKARRNIIAARENVTAWQVSQDALLNLKVDSWSSLKFPMQKVPSLHSLMLLEGKQGGTLLTNSKLGDCHFHLSVIRKAMSLETATFKKPLDNAKKKALDNAKKKSKRLRPLLWALKKQLDERFSSISQRVESFSSVQKVFCGKHTRFGSSGSDEGENIDDEDFGSEDKRTEDANLRSQNVASSSDRVSSCPYPSEIEEMTRLGLKGEAYEHLAPASPRHNESCGGSSKKKRKYENPKPPCLHPLDHLKRKENPKI